MLGQALHYLASQASKLKRYVEDYRYSIANNGQQKRHPAVLLRAAQPAARRHGGRRSASANVYSLLRTCQVNGTDDYRFLRALFIALSKAQTADNYAAATRAWH
jgi:transposase